MPPINTWLKSQMERKIEELGGRSALHSDYHRDLLVTDIDLVEHRNGHSHYVATLENGTQHRLKRVTTVLNKLDKSGLDRLSPIELDYCRGVGSEVHAAIHSKLTGKEPVLSCDESRHAFDLWQLWWSINGETFEILALEMTVWSLAHGVAGTLDTLLLHGPTGRLWLADWKTSRDVYESYHYQMGAYATFLGCLLPTGLGFPQRCLVLNIPRQLSERRYTERILWRDWLDQGAYYGFAWGHLVASQKALTDGKLFMLSVEGPVLSSCALVEEEDPDEIWEKAWR